MFKGPLAYHWFIKIYLVIVHETQYKYILACILYNYEYHMLAATDILAYFYKPIIIYVYIMMVYMVCY